MPFAVYTFCRAPNFFEIYLRVNIQAFKTAYLKEKGRVKTEVKLGIYLVITCASEVF
jgi:hypothetical protein